MTTDVPTDAQLQAAAQTLSTLVDLAAEGETGEPDLHAYIASLPTGEARAVLGVAAAVIVTERRTNDARQEYAAAANRDLRDAQDRYRDALQQIMAVTAIPKLHRIVHDALEQ